MTKQFKDTKQYIWNFGNRFLVKCPSCEEQAYVLPTSNDSETKVRLTCLDCGLVKNWQQKSRAIATSTDYHLFKEGEISIGDAVDWYFHLPLWLQEPCCGKILWAYNFEHLNWLKAFVSSDLRVRKKNTTLGWSNRSLTSRLPKWIKSRKNEKKILLAISRLEKYLD